MYTEGYLIDIVEEGAWKDAKVEGSQTCLLYTSDAATIYSV